MPYVQRPDAAIYYEVHGRGFPLLLVAPGGVSSQIEFWDRQAFNPIKEFADEFMVIAMDQRFAGRSHAPAKAFSYDDATADKLAVLDAVGAERAHIMGGCIGCAHCWRLIHDAPERVAAMVCQNPVGLDESNNLAVFYRMFDETMRLARDKGMQGVIEAAMAQPIFALGNGGGPFSQRIHDDAAFRNQIASMTVESYVALIVRFRDGIWPPEPPYFTVPAAWMPTCPAPMIVLPGSDPFHPTGIAHRLCREVPKSVCLDVDCREPAKLPETLRAIRRFLREHTPV